MRDCAATAPETNDSVPPPTVRIGLLETINVPPTEHGYTFPPLHTGVRANIDVPARVHNMPAARARRNDFLRPRKTRSTITLLYFVSIFNTCRIYTLTLVGLLATFCVARLPRGASKFLAFDTY